MDSLRLHQASDLPIQVAEQQRANGKMPRFACQPGAGLLSSAASCGMVWKIPLTYVVPFIGTTLGGLLNVCKVSAHPTDTTG